MLKLSQIKRTQIARNVILQTDKSEILFFPKAHPKLRLKDYVFPIFSIAIGLNQIFVFCNFGQRLATQSADLLFITYDCLWFEQSASFRKKLMIMRTICAGPSYFKTVNFPLQLGSFSMVNLKNHSKSCWPYRSYRFVMQKLIRFILFTCRLYSKLLWPLTLCVF